MLYLLNNCQNLNHAKLYGGNAMYDLWAEKFEDKVAREMAPGDKCLVISRVGLDDVTIRRYTFTGARSVLSDGKPARAIWVLEGELENQEEMKKTAAARHPKYSRFFNRRGNFNQWSVLRDA